MIWPSTPDSKALDQVLGVEELAVELIRVTVQGT